MKEPLKLTHEQIIGIQRYAKVFGTNEGEWVLTDLKKDNCGSVYSKGDSHHTAYLNGRRDVIFEIEEVLEMAKREIEEEKQEKGDIL